MILENVKHFSHLIVLELLLHKTSSIISVITQKMWITVGFPLSIIQIYGNKVSQILLIIE